MRKYTLFLSVAVHVAGATALFVVPLLALDSLPAVPDRATWIAASASELPQPSPAPRSPASTARASVPVEAPSGLTPDSDQPADGPGVPSFEPGPGSGEVPADIGGSNGAIAPPPPPPLPPAPEVRPPVRVGRVVEPPRKIVDVAPIYPQVAIAAQISGAVILEAIIAEDGTVRGLKVLRGAPFLDQAAIDAVRQWRFTPTRLGGVPVSVVMTVTVNFALR